MMKKWSIICSATKMVGYFHFISSWEKSEIKKNTAISELKLPNSHFAFLTEFNIVNGDLYRTVYFPPYIPFPTNAMSKVYRYF